MGVTDLALMDATRPTQKVCRSVMSCPADLSGTEIGFGKPYGCCECAGIVLNKGSLLNLNVP